MAKSKELVISQSDIQNIHQQQMVGMHMYLCCLFNNLEATSSPAVFESASV